MASRGERARAIAERHDAALAKAEQRAIERVNAALDKSYRDMERDLLASYQKHGANTDLLPRQRALVIMDEIRQQSELLNPQQGETIQQNYEAMIKAAHREGADLAGDLATALGDRRLMPFSEIPMDAVVAQARDGVRRLAGHGAAFASKASAVVEQGLIQGWGARRVGTALRSELGVTKSKAETIARTEVMSAYNSAAKARYERSGIELGQWLATRSDRLCPVCASRNMQIYPLNSMRVPAHPRCRCVILPVSPNWDLDQKFAAQYRDDTLAELQANGLKPDYGPSPFERAAGLSKAPKAVEL